ncbi:MAG TPA: CHAT domain-containing protein [Thermoanaerobaculia bacterium]|jgi:tetratricopeptide (TPR) repeat protein|nr:CHAT domain-containing protein [Thermoanaerobaculia bacterium]
MLQLRLTQRPAGNGQHRVEATLEGDGARRLAESNFDFLLLDQDEEDLRWYLEDYLQYPQDPAPAIARRIEERMAEIGTELFRSVFQASEDARGLWAVLRDRLPDTRVEIVTGVSEANAIPWELLRDPKTDTPLALSARSFVRAQPTPARRPHLPRGERDKIRILLVICRPKGDGDVPFRSVASRLIKGLDEANREAYDLDVLRPPTFEQLGRVLRQAKEEGRPYHVVHFDGHGTYGEIARRPGRHGYVLFESAFRGDADLVDGSVLGGLLAEAQVPVLVLNACRSARAEPADRPDSNADPDSRAQAFGSLAQEVIAAGVVGVVAMRYNVYVVTAAQLVAELYASLGHGRTLGEAVTQARKNLHDDPLREVAFDPRPLQDWLVPLVYEVVPLQLFPEVSPEQENSPRINEIPAGGIATAGGSLDSSLPPPPTVGFFGRDETLLALDQAFNYDNVVLLHSYAGSGKTSTAVEFARWYSLTGGVEGPVLFTSFERYLSLPRVLDQIGHVFEARLEGRGIHWLSLDDPARHDVALQLLSEVPVLWIWDNVEPLTGFPAGTESAWSPREQDELVSFLRKARRAKAKFLLTSRRDESAWLGLLPIRIAVPPMPILESLQLARALATQRGCQLSEIEAWRPLLEFAQGNPLTVTVLVGQALRNGFVTREEIESFVARLRSGAATFLDEASQGRSRSLGASLAYGFEHGFSEDERRKLAHLYLFQGFVRVSALCMMGETEAPWCLPQLRGLTREEAAALLERAADVGLLTSHGSGNYSIHPALPWYFRNAFEQLSPEGRLAAMRAFVEVMGELGNLYHDLYGEGDSGVIAVLRAEEMNLLHARSLARSHGWWHRVTSAMQGLMVLYDYMGRHAEWKRLVVEIVPDFVDPSNDLPLPGREEKWHLVTEYRVLLARAERQWIEGERLQKILVDWEIQRASPALAKLPEELDSAERYSIRNLAVSFQILGHIRRGLGRADCVPAYEASIKLAERVGEAAVAAVSAFNLGNTFCLLPSLRNLSLAEHWYRRSLDLFAKGDGIWRGRCLGQLGYVAYERFWEAKAAGRPSADLVIFLQYAAMQCNEALKLFPPNAIAPLAVTHGQLGAIFHSAGEFGHALLHYRQAIRYYELQGDAYNAAKSRSNMARTLFEAGIWTDALKYAEAALHGFEGYGQSAADMVEEVSQLIREIRVEHGSGMPPPVP